MRGLWIYFSSFSFLVQSYGLKSPLNPKYILRAGCVEDFKKVFLILYPFITHGRTHFLIGWKKQSSWYMFLNNIYLQDTHGKIVPAHSTPVFVISLIYQWMNKILHRTVWHCQKLVSPRPIVSRAFLISSIPSPRRRPLRRQLSKSAWFGWHGAGRSERFLQGVNER